MTEHGTYAGYNAHYSGAFKGEPVCRPCRDAANLYVRRRRARHYLEKTDALYVDALGTKRRLQALVRLGYTYAELGHMVSKDSIHPSQLIWHLLTRQEKVHINTARRVDAVYAKLSTRPGSNIRAQRRAIKKGWAPPAAWDDIDDPNCKPQGMTDKEISA